MMTSLDTGNYCGLQTGQRPLMAADEVTPRKWGGSRKKLTVPDFGVITGLRQRPVITGR
jgi:hypothetical protein